MADVGDIRPLHPVWPTRPADQGGRRPPPRDREPPARRPGDEPEDGDEEGHIDEYA